LQAPKAGLPAAKQNLVLAYFHKSATAHSIKDLEKALPSVASINGMQVKDYLQSLADDGKIRVEKIGSGNWYWSFLSEEKRNKEKVRDKLKAEKEKLDRAVAEARAKADAASAARADASEDDDDDGNGGGRDRKSLTEAQTKLQREVDALEAELALYKDNDPMEVLCTKEATTALRASAEKWTDNIYSLERYYLDAVGHNQQALEQLRQMLYGPDYQEGEGLAEL
jgi:hypothetical protein